MTEWVGYKTIYSFIVIIVLEMINSNIFWINKMSINYQLHYCYCKEFELNQFLTYTITLTRLVVSWQSNLLVLSVTIIIIRKLISFITVPFMLLFFFLSHFWLDGRSFFFGMMVCFNDGLKMIYKVEYTRIYVFLRQFAIIHVDFSFFSLSSSDHMLIHVSFVFCDSQHWS